MTDDEDTVDYLALSRESAARARAQIAAAKADRGKLLFLERDRSCALCDQPLNPGDESLCETCEFRASGPPVEDEIDDFSVIVFRCCCPTCQSDVDNIHINSSKELTLSGSDQTA